MKATEAAHARRTPISRERYRAAARRSGIAARIRRDRRLDLAVIVVAALFVLLATPWIGSAAGIAGRSIGSGVGQIIPSAQGNRSIDLPGGAGTVTAAPVARDLPDFTRDPALTLAGRVPEFALAPGRTVDVSLNGASVATLTPDATGAFSAALVLRDGSNALTLSLRAGTETVASSSYAVVLKRTPPTLTVTKPVGGAVVDGPSVTVEGKAEAGAVITVNERSVVPAPDGTFSTAVNATAGPLTLTIVATDRAGNQTTVKTGITVRDVASGSIAVSVTLDTAQVAPAAQVNATIRVTANGLPRADQLVTVLVGLYTIGSVRTDASGTAKIGFAAPPNAGDFVVLVLTDGGSGRASLTVAK